MIKKIFLFWFSECGKEGYMPHSSGGGSSHGGSHGSSRSKANMRYGSRFYRGANRFVYYLNGAPQYYFSEQPYTLAAAKKEKTKTLISNIFMIFWGVLFTIFGFYSLPKKVTLDYNTEIVINDSARLLSDTDEADMEKAFVSFQDKTGVTPAFYTINIKELKANGGTLHNYAYDLYVNTFTDEKHWLVVYCKDNVEQSWSWEGMIGDDCGSIISTDLENEFTKKMQSNLQNDSKSLAVSVIDTFDQIGGKAGNVLGKQILTLLFIFGMGGLFLFTAVTTIIKAIKKKPEDDPRINSVQCPTAEAEPATAKCEYCEGTFVVGVHTACPHCGAPIEEKWE